MILYHKAEVAWVLICLCHHVTPWHTRSGKEWRNGTNRLEPRLRQKILLTEDLSLLCWSQIQQERPVSPVPSCVFMKSDQSIMQPIQVRDTFLQSKSKTFKVTFLSIIKVYPTSSDLNKPSVHEAWELSYEQILIYNDGVPRSNPNLDNAGPIVRRPMGLNHGWVNRTRVCNDASSTEMQCLTRNPNRLRACAIVHTFILSPYTKRDPDMQVKISKQTLNRWHSFGDRSKIIKHVWEFS